MLSFMDIQQALWFDVRKVFDEGVLFAEDGVFPGQFGTIDVMETEVFGSVDNILLQDLD